MEPDKFEESTNLAEFEELVDSENCTEIEVEENSGVNIELVEDDEFLESNEVITSVHDEATAVEKDKENKMLNDVLVEDRKTFDARVQGKTADDDKGGDTETAVPNKSELIQVIVEPVKTNVHKEAEKSAECEEIGNNGGIAKAETREENEDSSILDEINLTVNIELKSKLEGNVRVITFKDCTKNVKLMEANRELKMMIKSTLERLDKTMASSKSVNFDDNEKKGEIDGHQSKESIETGNNIEPMDTKEQKIVKDKRGAGFIYFFCIDDCPRIDDNMKKKLKDLGSKTNTTINSRKCTRENFVIRGTGEEQIRAAELAIKTIMRTRKTNRRITHMISLPMYADELIKNFNTFKEDVLSNCGKDASGVSDKLFQIPSKFHLTIAVSTLLEEYEKSEAINALNYCKKEIVDPILRKSGPIVVELKGIGCMNDQHDQARILFVNVLEETGILQKMGNLIYKHFLKLGTTKVDRFNGKLRKSIFFHFTVMNVKYANKKLYRKNHLKSFDATNIISAHQDTFFGKIPITSIDLSQLGTSTADSYYKALASVPLT